MRLHASKAAEPRYSPACKLEEEGGATIFVTKYDLRNTKRGHPPSPNLSAFPHFHNAPDLQKHRYKTQRTAIQNLSQHLGRNQTCRPLERCEASSSERVVAQLPALHSEFVI